MASPLYTVLNLIKRAMRLLSVLNVGDNPTADEEQDCLEALNGMVDAWAILRLMIYTSLYVQVNFKQGQQSYEIGPNAADWVMARPQFIDGAAMLYAGNPAAMEQPIKILTDQEWRDLLIKGLPGTFITKLWYDYGFSDPDGSTTVGDTSTDVGSARAWLYPVPSVAGSIALYLPQAVSQFSTINQTIALPGGYRRALAYNLALEIAPEFKVVPSPVVIAIAAQSLEDVKRANVRLVALRCDPAVTRHQRGSGKFNIYTGQ